MPSVKTFAITLGDINFLLDQLRHTILPVRYDSNGRAIYGYLDASAPTGYHELGLLGTFDPLLVNGPDGLPLFQGARDPAGFRILHGFLNNLTGTLADPAPWSWGAADEPFVRLTPAQYNHYVHQVLGDHPAVSAYSAAYAAAHPSAPPLPGLEDSTARYADPSKTVIDYTPRMITQTISSSYMDHGAGVADSAFVRTDIATDTITETITYSLDGQITGTATIDEGIIRNQNTLPGDPSTSGIFTLFGQFFDHGLDFIDKGGQGSKIIIVLDPSDPLYRAPGVGDPGNTTITISRATPDGYTFQDIHGRTVSIAGADGIWNNGNELADYAALGADGVAGTADDVLTTIAQPTGQASYTNHTSPYIDQSQSYGSDDQVTNLLRKWEPDAVNPTQFRAGAELLDGHQIKVYSSLTFNDAGIGPDGRGLTTRTLPTLDELRQHMADTGRGSADSALTWDDINNLRARDATGHLIDGNGALTAGGYAYTGQALLLDMNPHFDSARLTPAHLDALNSAAGRVATGANFLHFGVDGQLTDGTYVGAYALAPWVNFANFSISAADPAIYDAVGNLLMDSVGDHYVAGDGRANENFGLTSLHHVFHENHNVQLVNLENNILVKGDLAARHDLQIVTSQQDANGNYLLADNVTVAWNPDKMFLFAKLVNEMEYQHVAIDQYARLVTPDLPEFVTYDSNINADISLEYSQAAFRFGHSQLRETIDAIDPNGMVTKFALSGAFLNPAQFAQIGASDILRGMSQQVSNEVDEFLTPAMQQSLLGQSLDLGAINIARGRDVGLPTLNETRRALHDALIAERALDPSTPHHTNLLVDALVPYTSWVDYGSQMLHPESLVNFIAAYAFDGDLDKANAIIGLDAGTIADGDAEAMGFTFDQAINFLNNSVTAADGTPEEVAELTAGANAFNSIDLWIGGLAEVHVFTGQLGSTFNAIFEDQMERLMDGDRFYYIYRLGMSGSGAPVIDEDLGHTIVTEQFKDIIERTTGILHLNGDVMGYSDSYIELGKTFVPGQKLLAYKGETIFNAAGQQVTANQGAIKYQLVSGNWVPILADFQTAHNYGQQIATYALAHPGAPIGIFSGAGGGTLGNGGLITKSNADLGIVNQQYIRDFRPNLGANDDGTDNQGFDSHEVLSGTDYRDYIQTGNGDDTAYGDDGDDILDGQGGADHLYGGNGQDALYGGDIEDFVDGGAGDDLVDVGSSSGALDVAIGGDGNDRIYGQAGIDEMYGGSGDDYMDAGGDTDIFFGDAGNDEMYAGDGPDEARGGDGDDIISGGSGPDMLKGERGDDIMLPGIGQSAQNGDSDEALGDVGFDLVAWSDLNVALDVAADLRNQNLTAAGGTTPFNPFNALLVDVEGLVGSKFGDRLIGTDAGTGVDGQPTGDNWLIGGGGADTFGTTIADAAGEIGSGGNDVIIGDSIRLDTLIGTYGSYVNGVDLNGNNTHGFTGALSDGLLGNAALGTGIFVKHFTGLLQTERFKDFVLGNDGGPAATTGANADIAVMTGNKADYTLTAISFNSAHEGTINAYKIVDNRAGSPDGTDLLIGVEKIKFLDQTLNLVNAPPVLALHAVDSSTYLDQFTARAYNNSNGSIPWAATPWVESNDTGGATGGQIQVPSAGGSLRFGGGDGAQIQRAVNLAGSAAATLSFDLSTFDFPIFSPNITVAVSFDGDTTDALGPVLLDTLTSATGSGPKSYSVAGPLTANAAIFLSVGNQTTLLDTVSVDNVQVLKTVPAASPTTNWTATFTENAPAIAIAAGPGITDDGTIIHSAKVVLTNAKAADSLTVGAHAASIAAAVSSAAGQIVVTLTGDASLADYQAAIQAVRFSNTSETPDPADRIINVTVNDGLADSNVAVATIHVLPVNDLPTANADRIYTNYTTSLFTVPDWAFLANDTDLDNAPTISGVSITGGTLAALSHPAGGPVSITDNATGGGTFGYSITDGIASSNTTVALTRDTTGAIDGSSNDDILVGDGGNSTLNGGNGNDIIFAGAGADALNGGNGNDILVGGTGNDTLDGGNNTDTAVFTDALSAYAFSLTATGVMVTGGTDGNDTLSNVELAQFGGQTYSLAAGSNASNTFNGSAGADLMLGFGGIDTMNGSAGADVMFGGAGNDLFRFANAAAAEGDTIADFQIGDHIDLSLIDANSGLGGDQGFTLVAPGVPAIGELAVSTISAGHYLLTGNTGLDVFHLNVNSDHALTASDFTNL
jgi:Ca2+-binding RTX toxin-like protein